MDRLACVDVFGLALQLLLRRHPEWRAQPAVVVDEDQPQGRILWLNESARRLRVLPGQRYGPALSLAPSLRAGVVSEAQQAEGVELLSRHLRQFSPRVQAKAEEPGVFWLDASGLELLYGSLEQWARALQAQLEQLGFASSLVVGFCRYFSYALARNAPGALQILPSPEAERHAASRVALDRLRCSPELLERLERLGVRRLGELAALPRQGLVERFGLEAYRLHTLAAGEEDEPFSPQEQVWVPRRSLLFEPPERDVDRLIFASRRLLEALLRQLAERQRAVRSLILWLELERAATCEHRLRPAQASLDAALLLDLLRLRLQAAPPAAAVQVLTLELDDTPADSEQLALFAQLLGRDRAAAERALARVRAEAGEEAVGRFVLRNGHLPEASFGFEPLERLPLAQPSPTLQLQLVRRILPRPLPLPGRPRQMRNEGWQPPNPEQGAVNRVQGPYVLSGGWWQREVQREYAFAETQRGDVLWIFHDLRRRRWMLQGTVE